MGERAAPPPCRSLFEDKASVSDITIAPFPRRAPPVKSFVAVPNKSLLQVKYKSNLGKGGIINNNNVHASRASDGGLGPADPKTRETKVFDSKTRDLST